MSLWMKGEAGCAPRVAIRVPLRHARRPTAFHIASASPSDSSLTNTIRCRNCGNFRPGTARVRAGDVFHPPSVREFIVTFWATMSR